MLDLKELLSKLYNIKSNNDIDNALTIKIYENKELIRQLIVLSLEGLKTKIDDEFFFKILMVAYNLNNDFKKYLVSAIKLVSLKPNNLNNWISLSFAYRNYGKLNLSDFMNFHIKKIMNQYLVKGYHKLTTTILLEIIDDINDV